MTAARPRSALLAGLALAATPLPTAAAPAPAALAPWFKAPAGPALPVTADGFIQRWLVLEPISKPNRTNTVFTNSYVRQALTTPYFKGQGSAVPRAGDKLKVGSETLTWHSLDAADFSVKLFNFAQALEKPKYGVIFHTVTIVDAPRDMDNVRLAVGSNSASMWWVNGQEALLLANDRRMVMDDAVSPRLSLKKGRNVIHGAVINGPGLSDFCVRFIDDAGKPVTGLTARTA